MSTRNLSETNINNNSNNNNSNNNNSNHNNSNHNNSNNNNSNNNNSNNNNSNNNNSNSNDSSNQQNISIRNKIYYYFSLIINVISVEVVLILYTVPIFLLVVPAQNLAYEKTCRVNLAYPNDVCDLMMTKKSIHLDCTVIRQDLLQQYNETIETILNNNVQDYYERILSSLNFTKLQIDICNAERESQTYESDINTKTSFGEFALNFITLAIVGELSDKKGYRKLSILVPLLGELFSYIVLLIASIFMNELPMEFSSVLAVLITALGGGSYCFNSGMYSLLSDKTEPNKRSKRFIIYAIFLGFAIIASSLLSAILLEILGYIKLICLCITINLIGILYLKFILKDYIVVNNNNDEETNVIIDESKNETHLNNENSNSNSFENPMFYGAININNNERSDQITSEEIVDGVDQTPENNKCFDKIYSVIKNYRNIIERKRPDRGRLIINILFILSLFVLIPVYGESANEYSYVRYQFGWNEYDQTLYFALSFIIYAFGSIFMMHVLKNLFEFSDQFLGLVTTSCSTISKILFIFATTGTMMYIARAFDAFMQVPSATIKSMLSNIGDSSELGKIFSICGMIEATARFITQFGYGKIYVYIKDTTYFKVSTVFMVMSLILFIIIYIIMKRVATKKQMEINVKSSPIEVVTRTSSTASNLNEPHEYITHM